MKKLLNYVTLPIALICLLLVVIIRLILKKWYYSEIKEFWLDVKDYFRKWIND